MLDKLLQLDKNLFKFIHLSLSNSLFDVIVPFLRNPYFWSPLYLFILVYMWQKHGKTGLWWCFYFVACFAFADFISASILKPYFHRIRPCNDLDMVAFVREIVKCGSGFSLPSSHASNHFAFAVFISTTIGKKNKYITPLAFTWAGLVCFAQIYVGVHYPFDILFGALLGAGIGSWIGRYFNRRYYLG